MKAEHIYIHFPFCTSKCPYCDFFSTVTDDKNLHNEYIEFLIREIDEYRDYISDHIISLYIGGGTPSLIEASTLEKIIKKFGVKNDSEITIEINPASAGLDKLRDFRNLGINRVSVGAQSFIDRDLILLGRKHSSEDVYRTYGNARKVGFENINLDLIIGIPGQTPASTIHNVSELISLSPEHVSTYILTFYENTVFGNELEKGRLIKMDDDLEMDLFELTEEILDKHGLTRYEISNFAKKGSESKQNLNTWSFGSYLGFGASAHSFYGRKRWANFDSVAKYYETVNCGNRLYDTVKNCDSQTLKNEYVILGMRKVDGIDLNEYNQYFGSDFYSDYSENIGVFIKNKSITAEKNRLKFSSGRMNIFNSIISEIIH